MFTPTKRDRSPAGSPGRELSPPPASKWGTVSATSRRKDWRATRLSGGDFFKREPGQEIDVYDLDYLKYMRKLDRGIEKPSSFYQRKQSLANPGLEPLKEELDKLRSERDKSTHRSTNKISKKTGESRNFLMIQENAAATAQTKTADDQDELFGELQVPNAPQTTTNKEKQIRYMATNPARWLPNHFSPSVIGDIKPLLDTTVSRTGKSLERTLMMERYLDRDPWIPSKKHMGDLGSKYGASPSS